MNEVVINDNRVKNRVKPKGNEEKGLRRVAEKTEAKDEGCGGVIVAISCPLSQNWEKGERGKEKGIHQAGLLRHLAARLRPRRLHRVDLIKSLLFLNKGLIIRTQVVLKVDYFNFNL